MARPLITLNHGERNRYPKIMIGREETIDIARVSDALAKLVPIGLQVSHKAVREKLGFAEPENDDDVLGAPEPEEDEDLEDPEGDPEDPDPDDSDDKEKEAMAQALVRALANRSRGDAFDRAVDDLLAGDGWEPLMDPVLGPVLARAAAALERGEGLSSFRAQLPELFASMSDAKLVETLRRMGFSAALSGEAGLG